MNRTHVALSSIALSLLLLGGAFGSGVVGHASGAVDDVANRPDAYAVEQGDRCIPVSPVGDATETVSAHYDYRWGNGTEYGSYGTVDRQASQVSQLYVYRGDRGDSLVFLHDRLNDGEGGGSVSMSVQGLPPGANWTVEDDDYETRSDRFRHEGTASEIDWVWAANRTDGAAVRGVAEPGYDRIRIATTFGEGSYGVESLSWPYADADLEWRVGNGAGELVPIDPDDPVELRRGTCPGAVPTQASLTAFPATVDAGERVALSAYGSVADDGIAAYRWDLDGDGEIDDVSGQPVYRHEYESAGVVTPTVEVVGRTGLTDTESSTVNVQAAPSVTAEAALPGTARVGESIAMDGRNSTGNVRIESHRWTIGNRTQRTGPVVEHAFDRPGTVNVTLEVVGVGGVTDETTERVAVTDDEPPTAAIDAPDGVRANETVTLDANASTDDRGITDYLWDVDGDGTDDETTTEPDLEVNYTRVGQYAPTVVVVDERGQTDESQTTIRVTPDETFAVELGANRTTAPVGGPIEFEANATPPSVAGTYAYAFGDGGSAAGDSAVHAYDAAGEYTVRVDATSTDGRTTTDSVEVTVRADDGGSDDGDPSGAAGGGGGGASLEPRGTPSIEVTDASLSRSTVRPGERLTVPVTLSNDGSGDGATEVSLTVDGAVVDSVSVFVRENATRTVGLDHRFEDAGTHDVSVGDVDVGTATVAAGPRNRSTGTAAGGGAVALEGLVVPADPVPVGSSAAVEATFENAGGSRTTVEATLTVDGEIASVRELSIPPGATAAVTFEHAFSSPGSYAVAVNGSERTVVVGEPDGGATTPEGVLASGTPPPVHVAVGLVALLALVAALVRWT